MPNLPIITIEDAARGEKEVERAEQTEEQLVLADHKTSLSSIVLDIRHPSKLPIIRVQNEVRNMFTSFLSAEGFQQFHTPKLVGASIGGAAEAFSFYYCGQSACSQSTQLYKQECLEYFERVFEVGSVFRAEDSYTHRRLCESVALDVEMVIKDNYFEVIDIVDRLFVAIFDHLNNNCEMLLETINEHYPFEPLKYLRKTLLLTFEEGVQMLKESGIEVDPLGDLNRETELKLGKLVLEKYDTEFYILHRCPLAVRPFITMPCYDDPAYSNSFDVFIRGKEIISGAQRTHSPDILTRRAGECGIDVKTVSTYIDALRHDTPPLGGFSTGLQHLVMYFCGLDDIRKALLFPPHFYLDPQTPTP